MIGIVDYGVGNLFSLKSSFQCLGIETEVSGDPDVIRSWDKIILPGVGAFGDAADKLRAHRLIDVLREEAAKGKPFMGICLGMQLLLDKGYEYGEHEGLGLIPGTVNPIAERIPVDLKIPHIGWNALHFPKDKPVSPIFRYIKDGDHVYFVHSYSGVNCDASVIATTEYGAELTAAVAKDNVFGCQFHPEKSGEVGLNILKAFAEL
ncbi:MAG: imidazole glycerol phosphate synthase subunit HisH [Lachnospiraceae bacterium]|nr:imidazole glycerol phosphate synthase subunit HisH [Lachnospiraceae bacterium]